MLCRTLQHKKHTRTHARASACVSIRMLIRQHTAAYVGDSTSCIRILMYAKTHENAHALTQTQTPSENLHGATEGHVITAPMHRRQSCQHTSASVSIRQHTSAYAKEGHSITTSMHRRQSCIRQHTYAGRRITKPHVILL
jgi:hypothetical protein